MGIPGQPPISPNAPTVPHLRKFDLDFPGGTPKALVSAIEKASVRQDSGLRLNVIIPDEFASTRLPALKMNNVDVPQLFQALEMASQTREKIVTGNYYYGGGTRQQFSEAITTYGFKTQGNVSDDSIWYFYVSRPAKVPSDVDTRYCRFYSLAPYLDRGLTVDDITTAIQTGWKMMGFDENTPGSFGGFNKSSPKISFHAQTKLLIAAGEPTKLDAIDAVLKALLPDQPVVSTLPPAEKAASGEAKPSMSPK